MPLETPRILNRDKVIPGDIIAALCLPVPPCNGFPCVIVHVFLKNSGVRNIKPFTQNLRSAACVNYFGAVCIAGNDIVDYFFEITDILQANRKGVRGRNSFRIFFGTGVKYTEHHHSKGKCAAF